jgi:hypothetical protein
MKAKGKAKAVEAVASVATDAKGQHSNQMDVDESCGDSRPSSPVYLQEVEVEIDVNSSTKSIKVSEVPNNCLQAGFAN